MCWDVGILSHRFQICRNHFLKQQGWKLLCLWPTLNITVKFVPKELKAVWEETTYEVGFGYPISKTSFSKMGLSKTSTSSHWFSSTFETTLELGCYNNKKHLH